LFASFTLAQSTFVKVSKLECDAILSEPIIQSLNGNINASVIICNGIMFQLAEIPAKLVSCKANVGSSQYKAILINEINGNTYTARKKNKNKLTITCNQKAELVFNFSGKLYSKNKCLHVHAKIVGALPHPIEIQTNNEK
jgi:hypothetical protein